MPKTDLYGKDLITTQELSLEELEEILRLALAMKKNRYSTRYSALLKNKTLMMLFYNPSTRTRQSFEIAMTELGGHALFIEPKSMRLKTAGTEGETIQDAAQVMSRYGHALGIRILEDQIEKYGDGNKLIREYAKYSRAPVINMADDTYHPCQGLADVMTLKEYLRDFRGKKFAQVWGFSTWVRSWCSVQESLLMNTRFGMDVTLAYPEGYDLDPKIIKAAKNNAENTNSKFEITHNLEEACSGANVIYSRNWMSPKRYDWGKAEEIKLAEKYKNWRLTPEILEKTDNAYILHCMPVDRGNEGANDVYDSKQCLMYDEAENRLHVQKAVLALILGDR